MSTCTTFAFGANSAALPVTRSSKRAPSGDEQVGLLQREHGGDRAVHARHAEVLLVRVGERAAGHERGHDGRVGRLGELEQLVRRVRADDAAAHVEHRALRLGEQLRRRRRPACRAPS